MSLVAIVSLTGLFIASVTDFKTREVPDWLNFSLIAIGFGVRLLFSLTFWNKSYIIEGLYGFGLGFLLAYGMFYSGQWGGGDSKMLMGLGALLGLRLSLSSAFVSFLINLLFVGAIYGFLWSLYLSFKNRRSFLKKFRDYISNKYLRRARIVVLVMGLIFVFMIFFISDSVLRLLLVVFFIFSFALVHLWAFVKAVEEACMLKWVHPEKLTEGDWIAKPVTIKGKYICGPKDLGITKKQIALLMRLSKKNRVRKILIKEGIPFVPSFFIALLVAVFYGNLVLLLIR